MMILKILDFTE